MAARNHIGDGKVNVSLRDVRDQIGDNQGMSNETIIARRLRELGLTQAKLAVSIGQTKQQVTRWVSGERKVPVHHAAAIARVLRIEDWRQLYDGDDMPAVFAPESDVQPAPGVMPPEPRRLPLSARVEVLGVVEAGSDGQFEVNLADGPLEEIELPAALVGVPDIFALFVAGESMAGVWMPGDTVYVSRRRPITAGCYVVVEMEPEAGRPPRVFLKQFVSRSDGKVRLGQYNPSMDLEVDARKVRHLWRALHWREWAA